MVDQVSAPALAADRVLSTVRAADLACQGAKETLLRPFGLSSALYGVLLVLSEVPGATGAEIARRCGVTPQTMSTLLPRLEDRELVTRTRHPDYRQVVRCHLTAAGEDLLRRADTPVQGLEDRLRGALSTDERATLQTLLARVEETAAAFVDTQSDR